MPITSFVIIKDVTNVWEEFAHDQASKQSEDEASYSSQERRY